MENVIIHLKRCPRRRRIVGINLTPHWILQDVHFWLVFANGGLPTHCEQHQDTDDQDDRKDSWYNTDGRHTIRNIGIC